MVQYRRMFNVYAEIRFCSQDGFKIIIKIQKFLQLFRFYLSERSLFVVDGMQTFRSFRHYHKVHRSHTSHCKFCSLALPDNDIERIFVWITGTLFLDVVLELHRLSIDKYCTSIGCFVAMFFIFIFWLFGLLPSSTVVHERPRKYELGLCIEFAAR